MLRAMRRWVACLCTAMLCAALIAVPGRLRAQTAEPGDPHRTEASSARTTLLLAINADGALVRVDGRDVGQSPLPALDIAPGSHTVEIVHARFRPFRWQTFLRDGAFVRVNVDLVPKTSTKAEIALLDDTLETREGRPWFQRWYVLTGIGVVALSAIVAGVVIASDGSAENGFPVPPIEM